jgi:hypothetical protein
MAPRGDTDNSVDRKDVRSSAATERMRRAIEAVTRDGTNRRELEDAARELVTELRTASRAPEQMLLQIKQLLAEAGLRPSYAMPNEPGTKTGLESNVYRDVIAWSIRHYYDETKKPVAPEA